MLTEEDRRRIISYVQGDTEHIYPEYHYSTGEQQIRRKNVDEAEVLDIEDDLRKIMDDEDTMDFDSIQMDSRVPADYYYSLSDDRKEELISGLVEDVSKLEFDIVINPEDKEEYYLPSLQKYDKEWAAIRTCLYKFYGLIPQPDHGGEKFVYILSSLYNDFIYKKFIDTFPAYRKYLDLLGGKKFIIGEALMRNVNYKVFSKAAVHAAQSDRFKNDPEVIKKMKFLKAHYYEKKLNLALNVYRQHQQAVKLLKIDDYVAKDNLVSITIGVRSYSLDWSRPNQVSIVEKLIGEKIPQYVEDIHLWCQKFIYYLIMLDVNTDFIMRDRHGGDFGERRGQPINK
jgi:hypothetical protein